MVQVKIRNVTADFDSETCSERDIDSVINKLVKSLSEEGEKLPRSKFKSNVKPYWNATLTDLKGVKVRCHRLWKEAGRPRESNNYLFVQHKKARKEFMRELKKVQKDHEKDEIDEIVKVAHHDRISFWKKVKKVRNPKHHEVFAVRNRQGNVVYDINEVVQVWREHFERISMPRESPNFDEGHFTNVTDSIKVWNREHDEGEFLSQRITVNEIEKGMKAHKRGKAAGCDRLTTEHFVHAGEEVSILITEIINSVIRLEYIPENLRRGTQIPLYKEKKPVPPRC